MKFIYPAIFRKTDEGSYQGFFPDLECCYAKGDTLEEAVDDANEADQRIRRGRMDASSCERSERSGVKRRRCGAEYRGHDPVL